MYEGRENIIGKVGSKHWVQWLNDPKNKAFSYFTPKDLAELIVTVDHIFNY